MQHQLKVTLRPNNQLSIHDQWVNTKRRSHSSGKKLESRSLDIRKQLQRGEQSRRGYGKDNLPKQFSRHTAQKIRESGAVVDRLCGGDPSQARVITLTLPANTVRAFQVLARYSAYIINRLFQKVRRQSNIFNWFFVWEYQKRGALHLHICLQTEDKKTGYDAGNELITDWYQILEDLENKTSVQMFAQPNKGFCKVQKFEAKCLNQEMRKSCGGYFSKYASKANKTPSNSYVKRFSVLYPVSRFFGSSDTIKELIKQLSIEGLLTVTEENINDVKNNLIQYIQQLGVVKSYKYAWDKSIEIAGQPYCLTSGNCTVFYIQPSCYQVLLESLTCVLRG
jgi:hypothetical protein